VRLSGRIFVILGAVLGILVVAATDQILPATSQYQAQMRLWLAGRATGLTAYVLLTLQVALGLVLSHPVNQSTWKLSKRLFPWHENLWVFVLAFLAAHIVSLVLDPFAGVGVGGALIPGLSSYRSWPVALGTLALYALLITGITARYTKALPAGAWLRIHRLAIGIFALTWLHGVLAGTDASAFGGVYVITGIVVVGAAAYRYWVSRRQRPTFSTSLPDAAQHRVVAATVQPPAGTPPDAPAAPRRAAAAAVARRTER
jgi:methionine sulfoxide reductase heme-binding subunit